MLRKRQYIVKNNRPAFYKVSPIGRQVDFAGLEAVDISLFGKKVQLGDKTLEQLLNVKVKDETDTTFEDEGRPQREKVVRVNFGETAMSVENELRAIKTAIESNIDSSKEGIDALGQAVMNVMAHKNVPQELNAIQYNTLLSALQRLNIPKGQNYEKTGMFKKRFFTPQEYEQSKAFFNIFLLNNRPTKKPIISFDNSGKLLGYEPISYLSDKWKSEDASKMIRMLDIENGSLVPLSFVQNVSERNLAELKEQEDEELASVMTGRSRVSDLLRQKYAKSNASSATSAWTKGKAPEYNLTDDENDDFESPILPSPEQYNSKLKRLPRDEPEQRRPIAGPSGINIPPPPPGPAPRFAVDKGKASSRPAFLAELMKGTTKLKQVDPTTGQERIISPEEQLKAQLLSNLKNVKLKKAPPRQAPVRELTEAEKIFAELKAKAAKRAGTSGSGLSNAEKQLYKKLLELQKQKPKQIKGSGTTNIKPIVSIADVGSTWKPRYNLW